MVTKLKISLLLDLSNLGHDSEKLDRLKNK